LSAERLGRSSPLASIKVENLHGKFGIWRAFTKGSRWTNQASQNFPRVFL
jgi:hypothetical protein